MTTSEPILLRVSATSRSTAVAGAIANVVREQSRVSVQAIGPSAVNQAVKAIAIAKSYLVKDGIEICFVPSFIEIEIEGAQRTAIRFEVERR